MGLLRKIPGLVATAAVLLCTATVAAQLAGVGMAWSRGTISRDKVVRFAGIVYGLDPLDLVPQSQRNQQQPEPKTREEILADRVQKTPRLNERMSAISKRSEEIRGVTLTLRLNRDRYVEKRDSFAKQLDQLEAETVTRALREVQITMEVAPPKQAKEILRSMLTAPSKDPVDNVMKDVVGIIKALPDDKLRKILAEFKSEEERQLLHQILVEIGDLDKRLSQVASPMP